MKSIKNLSYWTLALLLFMVSPVRADIVITEIMPCNTSTYINELYDYVGYAEIYNDGSEKVDLKGYSFVNNKKSGATKWSWKIEKSCTIDAKSYKMIFFDEVGDGAIHADYKIDTDGGTLLLMNNEKTVSSVKYTQQYPHLSYGKGKNGVLGYMEPSPKADNTDAYESIKSRCSTPSFSVAPGVQSKVFELELECATNGSDIYYTLNGAIPTLENAKLYKEPILIENTSVVRIRSFKKGMLPSAINTGSYIYVDAAHEAKGYTTPIVSISTDSIFYFDDMIGMYADGKNGKMTYCIGKKNYNQDWTRPANVEYIVDGKVVVNQEVETSIKGACTRIYPLKSLGLKANKKAGKKGFDYPDFFTQRPKKLYESLHLRNGGNAYTTTRYRDGYMQMIAGHIGLGYQAYEPVVCFIDGQYKGLMGLREYINKSYIETHYGLAEEEIDFIKLANDVPVAMTGTLSAYDSLKVQVSKDQKSEDYYQRIDKLMDLEEYMDYQIFEQFIVNPDWPGNNQKLWREKNNGRFHWIVYDVDFGLGLYQGNKTSNTEKDFNMLNYALGIDPLAIQNDKDWKVAPFADLMKNDEFKYRFLVKFMHHMRYSFNETVLDSLWSLLSPRLVDEYRANRLYTWDANREVKNLINFANARPEYIYQHLKEYYKGGVKASLHVLVTDEDGNILPSPIIINKQPIGHDDYETDYYTKIPLRVEVRAPVGYKFKKWKMSSKVMDEKTDSLNAFIGKLLTDMKLTAVFEKMDTIPLPTLQINEICASNNSASGNSDECGHYSDWIEIYNYGTDDIDLAGMYLTDNGLKQTKWMIPYGYDCTVVKAGERKIIWADDESWRGPLHANFKISSTGSFIGLSYNAVDEVSYLDSVSCPSLGKNESYGRSSDGDEWCRFSTCDGENQVTFGESNNEICKDASTVIQPLALDEAVSIYPNPVRNELNILATGVNTKLLSLAIYNMQGVLIRTVENINEQEITLPVEYLTPGMYILKAETNYAVTHKKFEKK